MPTTADEAKKKVIDFVNAHAEDYTQRELDYIRTNAAWGFICKEPFRVYDILRQIYSELDLIPEEQDMHQAFIKILEENFDINRDIIEVAGGIVPSLGKKLASKQKTGTLTVYDPRLITNLQKPDNLILKKEMFGRKTPLGDAKMLIAFMPCDLTPTLIDVACKNDLDFMIALCEGGARTGYEWIEEDDEWIGHMTYNAARGIENAGMGTLEKASLTEFGSPYPIIYNKRKKKS